MAECEVLVEVGMFLGRKLFVSCSLSEAQHVQREVTWMFRELLQVDPDAHRKGARGRSTRSDRRE